MKLLLLHVRLISPHCFGLSHKPLSWTELTCLSRNDRTRHSIDCRYHPTTSADGELPLYFFILPLPYIMMNAMCMKIRWKLPSQTFGSVMIQMAISDLYPISTFAWKFFSDHKLMFWRPIGCCATGSNGKPKAPSPTRISVRRWNGTGLRRRLKKCPVMMDAPFCGRPRKPRPLRHTLYSSTREMVAWHSH